MAGYTRADDTNQIADGNVINAAPLDGEFNALEAAFNVSSGHTHDGSTAGDGGPISKLGPSQQLEQTASTLTTTTDITVATDKFIQFRDSGLKILSSADGKLDIDADTELEMVAPTVDIDASTAVTIDTATLTVTGATNITGAANIVGDLDVDSININGTTIGHTDDTDLMTLASGVLTVAGEVSMTTLDIGGTNVTATAAELNLMDGGTSAGTTAVAGGDGIVTNDSGTMRQTTVDTFDTYLSATTKDLTNKTIDADNNTVSNLEVDNLKAGVLDTDLSSVESTDTTLASAKAIKAYVDSQVTAQDLDFQGDSGGALSIDLDSETLDIAGGTGIDTSGSGNTLTVAIDSTVATLTGSQTLENKNLTTPNLTAPVLSAGGTTTAGSILFKEGTDNGTNAVTLAGPASTADVTVTLPAAATTLAGLAVAQEYTASQNFDEQTLTDGSTIDLNLQTQQVSKVTLGGNRTFNAPSNHAAGLVCVLTIIQDGTGSRTATFNSAYKFANGTAPTLTTTASARDILVFMSDGTNLREIGRSLNVS
jgi:hypothetical protein